MRNRVTICQAWFAVSTAIGLYMPVIQKVAAEIPGAVRDIDNSIDSAARVNKLINARKAKAAPLPQSFNSQPIAMTYKQPMLEKSSTSFPRRQHR